MPQSALPPDAVTRENAAPGCGTHANETLEAVEACIKGDTLWQRLAHFQKIADDNPGPKGHGNRDTGTPGYAASVEYVAKLMRDANYAVTIQEYNYKKSDVIGTPAFGTATHTYALDRDWFVARQSGGGQLAAPIAPPSGSSSGCSAGDFGGFNRGNVALLEESAACDFDDQVRNARGAGAAAVVLYATSEQPAREARLMHLADIPVLGVTTRALGAELRAGAPTVRIDVRVRRRGDVDYNVIADSRYGDPQHVVVVDAHLDAIYGAGMLDNASGSTTILETALDMAKTHTRNRLRYIWFGGEEIGLLGSRYYTTHLTRADLHRIVFDVDVDVTATPNFDILVADPKFAKKAKRFPPNVIPQSRVGNRYFADFFKTGGVVSRNARFGNDGTDSFSFALAGVPNTGILTGQDCCKQPWETKLWGGYRGNYEGKIPSFNGGCVDNPHRWCDNLDNNDPFVFELTTKAVAYVVFELSNRRFP
ncbi:MAG TPA: M28 family peptidase [Candidatus Baltobacteraceae bacterium]|nr:M28 family peptidase [Candidatus Baltobacteraceae bacterium]